MKAKRRKRVPKKQRPIDWLLMTDIMKAIVPVLRVHYPDYSAEDIIAVASVCIEPLNTSQRGKVYWNADLSDCGVLP